MAKLTEKQANILRQALSGSIIMHRIGMYSDSWHFEGGEHIDGRSALGLHTRGLIRPHIDRDPSGIDYPYMISDAGREAIAAYDAKHAAIAANVSADAAPAWTPAVGEHVRIVRDGDNNGITGFVTKIDSTMPVEVYRVYDHWYYRSELELVKVAAPAPDAAQTAAAGDAVTWRLRWRYSDDPVGFDRSSQVIAIDGLEAAEVLKRGLGNRAEMAHVWGFEIVTPKTIDPRDAQIAALERELEAVKQMFDGYQTSARETEQALTRDLEAARTEAAALRRVLSNLPRYAEPFHVTYELAPAPHMPIIITNQDSKKPQPTVGQLWELLTMIDTAADLAEAQTDAALASARQRADSDPATWLTTADVRAQSEFAEDD